jgi:hypothetical protein
MANDKLRRPDRQKYTKETFIASAKKLHGDRYDYSDIVYVNGVTKTKIICSKHGAFHQYPFHHVNGNGCKQCGIEARSSINSIEYQKKVAEINKAFDGVVPEHLEFPLGEKAIIKCHIHGNTEISYKFALKNSKCRACQVQERNASKSNWKVYLAKVRSVTDASWKFKREYIHPLNKTRSRTDHHLDHQYSIYDGFQNSIPPYIIGHWTNLWLLPMSENTSKNKKSMFDAEILFKNYFWAIEKFNEIKEQHGK